MFNTSKWKMHLRCWLLHFFLPQKNAHFDVRNHFLRSAFGSLLHSLCALHGLHHTLKTETLNDARFARNRSDTVIYPFYNVHCNAIQRRRMIDRAFRFIWKLNWNETEMLSIEPNRLRTFSKWTNLFSMVVFVYAIPHVRAFLLTKIAKMCKQKAHIAKMRLLCCIMHSDRKWASVCVCVWVCSCGSIHTHCTTL